MGIFKMIDKEYTTRLRRTAKGYDNGGILGMVINECADKIDELEKRIVELEAALKPFANVAIGIDRSGNEFPDDWLLGHNCLLVGDCRAAKKALENSDES